jgi:glycosyltransferase involved in cell wall biosynthesis
MALATVAFCTYNRADRLDDLVRALRAQASPIPFEILAVNNNSTDNTMAVLEELAHGDGVPLRVVTESEQGIVPARNRAVEETLRSDYLIFLDDDELPEPGFVAAAVDAFTREGADCVGGRIRVQFEPGQRPKWLGGELLRYLGEADYGDEPLWVNDRSTPVWSGNAGYRTALLREGLRFDRRFNREGKAAGGGEDTVMFETLLDRGVRIRHRPDMVVRHLIEDWRLRREHFLSLSYKLGRRWGLWADERFEREVCGVPPFLMAQMFIRWACALHMWVGRRSGVLRQAMNAMHAIGVIEGRFRRWRAGCDGK